MFRPEKQEENCAQYGNKYYAKHQATIFLWLKVNIEKLTKSLNELIQKYNKTDKEIDDAIASINTELNNLTQSIENQPDLSGTVSQSEAEIRSLKRQILFIEESVQALEAYRTQNNQILLEIQNSINNEVVIDE